MLKTNTVGRKLYFSVLAVFLVFAVSFIVFQQTREKQYKISTHPEVPPQSPLFLHDWKTCENPYP